MAKRILYLLVALLLIGKKAEACSPIPTPSLISQSMSGSTLYLNLQSTVIYNCTYSIEVELACFGGTMSGVAPFYYTSPAFQASTNPYTIPQCTVNFTGLCQGGVYQWRYRQTNSVSIFSPWSSVFTFTMPGVPVPTSMTLTASPTLICYPNTSQLTASVSGGCGGGGGATYSWSPPTGLSCTNCANPIANPTTTTTYTCSAFGTGQVNCWSVTRTITLVSPPSGLAMTVSNQTVCVGATTTISATGSPTYTWNTGSNASSIVVTPTTNTTYVVSGGASPCIGTYTVNITTQPMPTTPTVTPNNFLACAFSNSILTAVSNVTNFAWYSGGTIMATPQNTLAVPNGTGAYSWFVTAMSGTILPQVTYSFTTCGATGQNGPSQAQQSTAYAATNLSVGTTCTNGIQYWTVPITANYSLVASGASGGNSNSFGGRGRVVSGVVNLTAGTVLKILVGQAGYYNNTYGTSGGGGGGSYITSNANVPYLVAGGGGGLYSALAAAQPSTDGNILQPGFNSICGTGTGGAAGSGGTGSSNGYGGGGGGFNTNGTNALYCSPVGGSAFVNGGSGGSTCYMATGGFGGGAGTYAGGGGGGGGGGYSGGGGSNYLISPNGGGGGGSYFAAGLTSTANLGTNLGDGYVTITRLPVGGVCQTSLVPVNFTISPTPSLSVSDQTICAGVNTTLSAAGGVTYTWSIGANTSSIVVAPSTNTLYTVASGTAPCNGQVTVNVTVATPTPPTVTPNNTTFCQGQYSVFTAVSNATSYNWYTTIGGSVIATSNTLAIPNQTGSIIRYVSATQTLSSSGSLTFNATGSPTSFVVPAGVTQISVDVYGAEGGDAVGTTTGWGAGPVNLSGGDGGRVQAVITTTPGETLNLYIGTKGTMTAGVGGYNGGGSIGSCLSGIEVIAAGGGGASDIRRGGVALSNRIVVAGGGGGAAGSGNTYYSPSNSGAGGGLTGASATSPAGCTDGLGGGPAAGGAGGDDCCWCGLCNVAGSGSLGLGGNSICNPSGLSTCGCNGTGCTSGGGGGGGYYGGGAGIAFAGGGGGSSYCLPAAITVTHTQGVRTGNGLITIAWTGAGVCTSSLVPVSVTVVPSPTVNASATPTSVCTGSLTSVLSASGATSYTWFPMNTQSSTVAVTPTVTTIYTVIGTSTNGCTNARTVTVTACAALPLELVSFEATKENEAVKLNWITKTEKNTEKFIIERSADINKWTNVCELKAAGNSSSEKHYNCYDAMPLQGISYYRLKIQDLDKSIAYSDVKIVQFDRTKGSIVIHPNPAHDKLFISYAGDVASEGIKITDVRGKTLIKNSDMKPDPENGTWSVDISSLLPGVYFVIITENGVKQAKKFIVE